MSPESLRGWDALIRPWVRHPHVEGLWESVCYQLHSNGRAALAWRYEDWQAAERGDGTRGRPLVSRVLVGQVSSLTPEVAIVLCRTGLPATAGPRPGQVTTEAELSVFKADELSALVSERTEGLDEEAARQEGLRRVAAAALSDPFTPLAIHVRDAQILKPPGEGVQCRMLWGLRRILWPLLGPAGRGWSFSTFEPPLGADVDTGTLPDILFRQTQAAPLTAPARPRKEIKTRPFDPSALDDESPPAQLAGWLVAEYQERGGDDLSQLIAKWCGAEPSLASRLNKVYGVLRARQSPALSSGPTGPFTSVSPTRAPERKPSLPQAPAEPQGAAPDAAAPDEAAPDEVAPDAAAPDAAAPDAAAPDAVAPDEAAPAGGRPLEAGTAPSPPVPAMAGDQADLGPPASAQTGDQVAPQQQAAAPDEARLEPVTEQIPVREEIPGQETEPPQAGADPAFTRPGEQDRQADQGWFGEADRPQPGYAGPPPAGWTPDPPDPPDPAEHGNDPRGVPAEPVAQGQAGSGSAERTRVVLKINSLAPPRDAGSAYPLGSGNQGQRPLEDRKQQAQAPRAAISNLLKQLPTASDAREFEAILRDILYSNVQPDTAERVKARREVSKDDWYEKIREQFSDQFNFATLSDIFQVIIIPDLDNEDVTKKIAEWAEYAKTGIIAGLLTAAKQSGDDTWHSMMQILQPKLAYRWMTAQRMQALWDPGLASQPPSEPGRSRFSFFKRS